MDVPQARRIERPGWLNGRTVLGLVLFAAAVAGGNRIIQEARTSFPIWTVAADLPSGSMLDQGDLVAADVWLPDQVRAGYALSSTDLEGAVLTRALHAGEMIPLDAVAPLGTVIDGRLVTIPIAPEHAVGGSLAPGDRIDVFVTLNAGQTDARTTMLVSGAEVIDVVTAEGVVVGSGGVVGITLMATPLDVERIVHAIRTGEIDIAKVSGDPSAVDLPIITSEDLGG